MPAAKQPSGVAPFAVALVKVPAVLTQAGFDDKLTAPAQLSLAGGVWVIQILKLPVLLLLCE